MCGIVGIAGEIGFKGEKAFRRLLELDTIRGPHSTGIFSVKTGKDCHLFKQTGTPWDLYQYKGCEDIFKYTSNVLLGHNRWATKGKVNRANAHPFEFDNVAGVHNGTLRTVYQLDDHTKFDVDSENIYHHMNKHGVHDTLPKLNGAFALVWYDKVEETINFARNDERPLFYAFSENMKTLVWASEPWMIDIAMRGEDIKMGAIVPVPVNTLMTFEVKFGFINNSQPFERARIRTFKGYEAEKKVVTLTPRVTASTTSTTPVVKKESALGKVQRPFAEYSKHVLKPCQFLVGRTEVSQSGQDYIQCWLVADEDISVRVFPQKDGVLWNQMISSTNYFKGVAKAYNGMEGGYLTIDLRTVEEVVVDDDVPEDKEELYTVYDGVMVNEEGFDEATKQRCAWCSAHVFHHQHEQIKWISKRDFLCPDCVAQPEVSKYLMN